MHPTPASPTRPRAITLAALAAGALVSAVAPAAAGLAAEAILAAITVAWLHRNPAPGRQARSANS